MYPIFRQIINSLMHVVHKIAKHTFHILQHLFGYFVDVGHSSSIVCIRNQTLLSTRSITTNRNIIYDDYNKNNENHKPCGKSLSTLIILMGTLFLDIYLQKLVISFHDKIIRSSRWQTIRPATLLKRDFQQRYFPVNIAEILRAAFSQNTSSWIILGKLPWKAGWSKDLSYSYSVKTWLSITIIFFKNVSFWKII